MSGDASKSRGDTGKKNAEHQPFRLNGRAPDWFLREQGVYNVNAATSSGSKSALGILTGYMLMGMGYGRVGGTEGVYERMLEHAAVRSKIQDWF